MTTIFDPIPRLRKRNQRQKSDVAQKLIAMCLHEVSASLVRERTYLRVESADYEVHVRKAFGNGCAFCGDILTRDLQVEHLDAMNRVRAGLHIAGNVVLSCKPCNSAKRGDDQGKSAFIGNDGWALFLRHTGAECRTDCAACAYWAARIPHPSTRTETLEARLEKLVGFRAPYHLAMIRAASLDMVAELERVYRAWQNEASASTAAFSEALLPRLLAVAPAFA
jgi:hypothetical protein